MSLHVPKSPKDSRRCCTEGNIQWNEHEWAKQGSLQCWQMLTVWRSENVWHKDTQRSKITRIRTGFGHGSGSSCDTQKQKDGCCLRLWWLVTWQYFRKLSGNIVAEPYRVLVQIAWYQKKMQNIAKTEARGDTEYEMCFGKASARAYVLWQVNTVCSMNLYKIFIIYMVPDGDSRWREGERERERERWLYIQIWVQVKL